MSKLTKTYAEFLDGLKKIASARYQAARTVNQELVLLYWDIGKSTLDKQEQKGWGKKVIQQIARDLAQAFPEMKGFSERNLDYMCTLARLWPDRQITQKLASKTPWEQSVGIDKTQNFSGTLPAP
jgi:predicted nuclease of restriction endonuclease-like (RecB) superfamily